MYEKGLITREMVISVRNSYMAHLKHGSCRTLVKLNCDKMDLIINNNFNN